MAIPTRTRIQVLVTDAECNLLGDPVNRWSTVDCTLRHNAVGSGHVTMPAWPEFRELVDAGRRMVVVRNGEVFIAGPIEQTLVEQSDDGENSGVGKLTVDFADDLVHVGNRITYADPALTPEAQTTDEWVFSGNAEQALRQLVHLNVGAGARLERRAPRLVLGAVTGVGSTVSVRTGLEPLLEVLRSTALAGGDLGFRTRYDITARQIYFEVFAPRDLSDSVRFGFGLNNLRYLSYGREAPTATTTLVGGQGEPGADRALITRTNTTAETAWGRVEVHVARSGQDPVEDLQAAGDEALAEGGETARLQTSAFDSPDQRFPDHYRLGDRVSVQVGPGEAVTDLVRVVHLQAWDTAGELVSATVGTQEATTNSAWVRQLRGVDRRLSRLERRSLVAPS
ncbi:hypothetical protein E1091_01105 [Micromonospora fluostatini]|uniref:Gp28/Gp37-like domain-containing protein n=1 Tax=Micromonospora fluostatini TaxID=1629071 RepID=A0ABY2DP33_9ACTN|nr:hypothetical protein E1091_01105 [Micromonospora fluostatini]